MSLLFFWVYNHADTDVFMLPQSISDGMKNFCSVHSFVFLLEEQLVVITSSNYTVKWYKVSGINECIVLRHFRITAETWSHLQVILEHMWIISRLQISEICFTARYYCYFYIYYLTSLLHWQWKQWFGNYTIFSE